MPKIYDRNGNEVDEVVLLREVRAIFKARWWVIFGGYLKDTRHLSVDKLSYEDLAVKNGTTKEVELNNELNWYWNLGMSKKEVTPDKDRIFVAEMNKMKTKNWQTKDWQKFNWQFLEILKILKGKNILVHTVDVKFSLEKFKSELSKTNRIVSDYKYIESEKDLPKFQTNMYNLVKFMEIM